jgi:hypothetical protein
MLLLNFASVKRVQKISNNLGGGPSLAQREQFGRSIAPLGDLDGDGVLDLAIASDGTSFTGAVYTMFLNQTNIPPVITSPSTASVPENATTVMTMTASDANVPPQAITFSLVAGGDSSRFNITSAGVLSFTQPPTVRAQDILGGTATHTISVTVTPVNEHGPVFTSPDAVSVPENSMAVTTVTATDADLPPQTLAYSIVGGADQSKFSITPGGSLSFIAPPNFEAPTDANGDNLYLVVVQASDGNFTNLQAILVTVTNVVDELPLIGDYNANGTVDAADYIVWRNSVGQVGAGLPADGNGNGQIDAADYNLWRANFGRTLPGSGTSMAAASELAEPSINQEVADSEPVTSAAASFAEPILRPHRHRTDTTRPPARVAWAESTARDRALAGWLASSRSVVAHDRQPGSIESELSDNVGGESTDDPAATFELAFASLGAPDPLATGPTY